MKIINRVMAIPGALNNIAPWGIGTSSTPKKKKKDIAKINPEMLRTLEKNDLLKSSRRVVKIAHVKIVNNITIDDSIN